MLVRSRLLAAASVLALSLIIMQTVFAGTVDILYDIPGDPRDGTPTGVRMTTPDTYHSCTATFDTIYTEGVGNRELRGRVIVDYLFADNTRAVAKVYEVNQVGDLRLDVEYPPVSQWPSDEIHVDVQLELYEDGQKVASIGGWQNGQPPANDWDVFCHEQPTSTPVPTNTPTPVPTSTPTPVPTNTPTPVPTSTPTSTPTAGGQGCTPGYWKQQQHFDSWSAPYTPGTSFSSVFGVGPSVTLLQALGSGGGGEQALMRHATAALLNAASGGVDYKYSVSEVIALVQMAYSSGNFEAVKNQFAVENERGCSLN